MAKRKKKGKERQDEGKNKGSYETKKKLGKNEERE
jgi:hypothetical protein